MNAGEHKKTAAQTKLPPCPASPNCVSSQDPDERHAVAPFAYRGSPDQARSALLAALQSMPRTKIVSRTKSYVRAEFRSAVFKFLDVGEFVIRERDPVIDVRSASQTGYYDFGVNRKRLEELRRRFNRQMDTFSS